MSDELKPCPFCGSPKIETSNSFIEGMLLFQCDGKCGMGVSYMYYGEKNLSDKALRKLAIKAWNTRKGDM